ncbi:PREDICTED: protein UXT isoform X1 [Thamnophis sirtalis]|uniref:Protein UXT n=1 Tax=Thamnophis sirtalis TaxID=35019 RepID=A0A6I9YKY5_9SAUR|nr:PREDICTED: protein UXT isoform X1 [Thamnophis sirtalis]XP_013924795.1 PREDICTED: protein UXT isoform X1 [Thamnophis sirtalis]XP_013924796.1 PREDICTED: protein UXT isoform X1 [Thamnophis sirtalis]
MVMLSEQQLQEKVLQYEAFISDVLQRDLKKVLEQRDEIYEKIAQYLQLKNIIERLQETGSQELKTQVDLGCHFYVNAEVPDTSTMFVALGYGFFVELTLPEALTFIEKKTKLLNELSETLTKDSARIKANIRMVLEATVLTSPSRSVGRYVGWLFPSSVTSVVLYHTG